MRRHTLPLPRQCRIGLTSVPALLQYWYGTCGAQTPNKHHKHISDYVRIRSTQKAYMVICVPSVHMLFRSFNYAMARIIPMFRPSHKHGIYVGSYLAINLLHVRTATKKWCGEQRADRMLRKNNAGFHQPVREVGGHFVPQHQATQTKLECGTKLERS